ncbi:MAG: hypothetical protein ABEJ05_04790 [Haloglomus sp.]
MDETDRSRDETAGHEGADSATAPRETADDGETADDEAATYDRETVEATLRDVEGIEYDGESGNVAGAAPGADLGPVEPESPTLEGSLFVLLGAALTLLVLAQLVGF